MTQLSIQNDQMIALTINPTHKSTGRPAKTDGPPLWEVVDGTSILGYLDTNGVLQLGTSPDGLSAVLIASYDNESEVAHFKVTADADLGEGVITIEEDIELTVTIPAADTLQVTAGNVTTKPDVKPVAVTPPVNATRTAAAAAKRRTL